MKIGIFIGSFNPPTLAHLEIVLKLKNIFDKIVFVPVNSKEKVLIDFNYRVEMLKNYQRKYSFLEIDDVMKDFPYLNYKILNLLAKKYGVITLIIGSDLLDRLDSFENSHYLIKHFKYVVIDRNGYDAHKIIKEKYYDNQENFKIIDMNNHISSTLVRENIKEKKSVDGLLDQDILLYIKNNGLYF